MSQAGSQFDTSHQSLRILFQDDYLIAVAKPPGLLVHRSALDVHDHNNALKILRAQTGQFLYPVHRLDKPTSGVLLFATNSDSARIISQQFEQNLVNKHYLGIVRGHTDTSGCIDYAIRDRDARTMHRNPAVTSYTRLATIELEQRVDKYPTTRYSLVELRPTTGRRHQIRIHMKHISHPLLGDTSYGKAVHNRFFIDRYDCRRLLLHAQKLVVLHPRNGTEVSLTADIDHDATIDNGQFQRVLADDLWRWDTHQ